MHGTGMKITSGLLIGLIFKVADVQDSVGTGMLSPNFGNKQTYVA
jgi:hypothetical protein